MADRGASGKALESWVTLLLGTLFILTALLGLFILPSSSFASPSSLWITFSKFRLTEQGRELELALLNASPRSTRLSRVLIDGMEVLTWDSDLRLLNSMEQTLLRLRYNFQAGATHQVEIETDRGQRASTEFTTPAIPIGLDVIRFQPRVSSDDQQVKVELALQLSGYNTVTLLIEPYASYATQPLPIYLFDGGFLSEPARTYADAFLHWAERLDPPLSVQRVNWESLEQLARARTAGIVVIFTPLQAHDGPIDDSLPAVLLNSNDRDQGGLAFLQSWLRAGLVLVTPTTTHPLRVILRDDRRVEFPPAANPGQMLTGKVNTWWSVTARYARDSASARALLWGRYQGEYGGVGELADSQLYGYREATNQFTQGPEEIRGRALHLYNPFFLKSGRGGWLALSTDPPAPDTLGHDLALLLTHAPWQAQPLAPLNPGFTETIQPKGGAIQLERRISLEIPPGKLALVRLLVVAEDSERQRLVYREWRVPLER